MLEFLEQDATAFSDIKVVSPYARSYCDMTIARLLVTAEKAKSGEYRERILNVEHGDFSLVFTPPPGATNAR